MSRQTPSSRSGALSAQLQRSTAATFVPPLSRRLSAAYELRQRGNTVTMFEASDRPGGRTWTISNLVNRYHMDGGAVLIGSNHPLWLFYADHFHLGFSDVLEDNRSPLIVGTKRLGTAASARLLRDMNDAFIRTHDAQESRRFDEVILAIPPSTWCKILYWSPQQLASFVGVPPQMGKNIKGLFAFQTRFWKHQKLGASEMFQARISLRV